MTNKPDYNEDKDQVEEEQEQETGETTIRNDNKSGFLMIVATILKC